MKFLGASQRISFSMDQRRTLVVLELEEEREEGGKEEEEVAHRTHLMAEGSLELASEEPSPQGPTRELVHPQPLEIGIE